MELSNVKTQENIEQFNVRSDFLNVMGIEDKIMTGAQVLHKLQNYIYNKSLFDPKNPRQMHLKDDPLATVFGTSDFTIYDVTKLLSPILTPLKPTKEKDIEKAGALGSFLNGAEGSSQSTAAEVAKREYQDETSLQPDAKRPRLESSTCYLLIPGTPSYNSGHETDYSIQSKETVYVTNSNCEYLSDFSTSSDSDFSAFNSQIDGHFEVEYELESVASSCANNDSDTASEIDDVVYASIDLFCKDDSDVQFWADESDEEEPRSDPELSSADKWHCYKCNLLNKPPNRYCNRCWEERLNWIGDKNTVRHPPTNKRRRKGIRRENSTENGFKLNDCKSPNDSSTGALTASQESNTKLSQESMTDSVLFNLDSQECGDSSAQPSSSSASPPPLSLAPQDQICPLCMKHPKTGIILHGKTSHQYCCYKCARNLQDKNKKCPVCRRTITKVARNFIVMT